MRPRHTNLSKKCISATIEVGQLNSLALSMENVLKLSTKYLDYRKFSSVNIRNASAFSLYELFAYKSVNF